MAEIKSNHQASIPAILQLAFRPFFILSAAYGLWLLLRWILTLSGIWSWQSDIPLFGWHSHEFQFGFAFSVVIGFLLTAAQTWTGQPSIKGRPLLFLVLIWLIARLGMNLNQQGLIISAVADSLVILIAAATLLRMVLRGKNYRNMIFLPLLTIFLVLHLSQIYAMHNNDPVFSKQVSYATSWWFAVLISLIGSRVIPFFIGNAVGQQISRESKYFTLLTQLLIVALAGLTFSGSTTMFNYIVGLSLILHCYRLVIWHHKGIWKNPMLWSLWISYSFLPLALATLLFSQQYNEAMHLINVGLIATMIMAFTSRVSLGHTGRGIKAPIIIQIAFVGMVVATLTRSFALIIWPEYSLTLMTLTTIFWAIGLICYLGYFTPILTKPRLDGAPG